MPTLLKRNSSELRDHVHATATSIASSPDQQYAGAQPEPKHGTKDPLSVVNELMAAWGEGKLDMPDTFAATMEQYYARDLLFDVKTANAHVMMPEFKEYNFETLREWNDWTKKFDIADVVANTVLLSKDDSQVLLQLSYTITSKETGRQVTQHSLTIFDVVGDKVQRVMVIFSDPSKFAYLTGLHDKVSEVEFPTFEPSADPKAAFEKVFAAWSSGEFMTDSPTQRKALDELVHPDFFVDTSSAALPDVFRTFHGHKGCDEWANGLLGEWEFQRMESTVVSGLRPGRVLQKFEGDIKLKEREAKGIVLFNDIAYDSDGKVVAQKVYWVNPEVVAALYETPSNGQ